MIKISPYTRTAVLAIFHASALLESFHSVRGSPAQWDAHQRNAYHAYIPSFTSMNEYGA